MAEAQSSNFERNIGIVGLVGLAGAALATADFLSEKYLDFDLVAGKVVFVPKSTMLPLFPMPLTWSDVAEHPENYHPGRWFQNSFIPWLKNAPNWDLQRWCVATGFFSSAGALYIPNARAKGVCRALGSGAAAVFSLDELGILYEQATLTSNLQWGGGATASAAFAARQVSKVVRGAK